MSQGTLIGQLLVQLDVVGAQDCVAAADDRPLRPTRFASRLLAAGAASEEALVGALAMQQGVPGVDLSRTVLETGVLAQVPQHLAEETLILPLARDAEHLHVALANPHDTSLLDELGFVSGRKVVPHVALQASLRVAIPAAYRARTGGRPLWAGPAAETDGPFLAAVVARGATPASEPAEDDAAELTVDVEQLEEPPAPAQGGEPAGGALPGRAGPGRGRRILVVDDEGEILTLLGTSLLRDGYRVETASRGLEALHKIKAFEPELIILDAMLPEVHGFEICRKVRRSKRFGHVPVLMITALYRGWRFAQDAKETYGATDLLEKPFHVPELLKRVRAALDGVETPPEASAEARARALRAYQRGVGMLKVGRVPAAIAAFRDGVAEDPFAPALHFSLGRALALEGDGYAAIAAYERAVELKPDMHPALERLARLYEDKGFRRKAIETWERALPVAPDETSTAEARRRLLALLEGAGPTPPAAAAPLS